jgi:hypothetical protein
LEGLEDLEHKTLVELSSDREVRKAAGFREVAKKITPHILRTLYDNQVKESPRRGEAGKPYFAPRDGTLPKRGAKRDEDQLAIALANHARATERELHLPSRLPGDEAGTLRVLDYHVPLKVAAADPGVARIDALGIGRDDRMVVLDLRWLAPSAKRGSTGDTPLRYLLEGLTACAALEANGAMVRAEAKEKLGVTFSEEPPILLLMASPRWWELARKREAQKGAAWINQLERLARVLEGSEGAGDEVGPGGDDAPPVPPIGVEVRFVSLHVEADPAWTLEDDKPTLAAPPRFATAWESTAGRIKPKSRPRGKPAVVEPEIIEPDLSRPVRGYKVHDAYSAGDRIDHPTLGLGVVQGVAGPTKIEVLFDGEKKVLVHDRPSPGGH